MAELPVIGAQLSTLDLQRHRGWLFEKIAILNWLSFVWAPIFAALAKTGQAPYLIVEINDFTQVSHNVAYFKGLGPGR